MDVVNASFVGNINMPLEASRPLPCGRDFCLSLFTRIDFGVGREDLPLYALGDGVVKWGFTIKIKKL